MKTTTSACGTRLHVHGVVPDAEAADRQQVAALRDTVSAVTDGVSTITPLRTGDLVGPDRASCARET